MVHQDLEKSKNIFKRVALLEQEAAEFGFKWDTSEQILQQIESEILEVKSHLYDQDKTKLQEEIGDLLHAVFSLCVFCKLDPRQTLENSVDKFAARFTKVKDLAKQQGLMSLNGKIFAELMQFWDEAKKVVR